MTALTVSTPRPQTTIAPSPELDSRLKCWLLDERSDHVAIETIAKSDILTRLAKEARPALWEAAMRSASAEEIMRIIGQRFELFPQPKRDEGQWASWWADYIAALEGLTPYAVEAGMAAWVRDPEAEFMCKPGKLRELATTVPNDNRWARAHDRARKATFEPLPPAEPEPEKPRPSKEEMAALMADFHEKMKAKQPPQVQSRNLRPTPCAPIPEGSHMSDEMRALLGRAA